MGTAAKGRNKAFDALDGWRDYAVAQRFWPADCGRHSTGATG
jgi:hypothetical protein